MSRSCGYMYKFISFHSSSGDSNLPFALCLRILVGGRELAILSLVCVHERGGEHCCHHQSAAPSQDQVGERGQLMGCTARVRHGQNCEGTTGFSDSLLCTCVVVASVLLHIDSFLGTSNFKFISFFI